jgi:hypothetical protein
VGTDECQPPGGLGRSVLEVLGKVLVIAMALWGCSASSPEPTVSPLVLSDEEHVWCAAHPGSVLQASYALGIRTVPDSPAQVSDAQFQADLAAHTITLIEVWPGKGYVVTLANGTRYGIVTPILDDTIIRNTVAIAGPNPQLRVVLEPVPQITEQDQIRVCQIAFNAR